MVEESDESIQGKTQFPSFELRQKFCSFRGSEKQVSKLLVFLLGDSY